MANLSSTSSSSRRSALVVAVAGTSLAFGGFLLARSIHNSRRKMKALGLGLSGLPHARRSNHSDEYFGHTVADPYRWMEQTDAEETKAWIEAQIKYTNAFFKSSLEPERSKFLARLQEVFNFDKYAPPIREGNYWFFYLQKGLSPQAVLYKREGLDGTPEVLLDPNTLSKDGTSALKGLDFSKDGKKLAYGISEKGSDWFTIHVKDIVTGEELLDKVPWCKFGDIVWEKEARGFFYSAFPRPKALETEGKSAGTEVEVSTGHRVMFHRLGTDASEDQLVYQSPLEEKWMASAVMADDWETLLISINDSCDPVNRLFYRDLTHFDGQDVSTMGNVVKLVDNFDCLYDYITNDGRAFWFRTNMDAPKYKVVRMQLPPVDSPLEEDEAALAQIPKTTVVAEDANGVLSHAAVVSEDRLVLEFERDAYIQLELCNLDGADRKAIPVPGIGTISGISCDKRYDHIMFSFTNFVTPGTIYHATVTKSEGEESGSGDANSSTASVSLKVYYETKVPGISSDEFETKQVRYESKDGTQVPMFIVGSKAQQQPDGDSKPSPCLLYGYGGFNISLTPSFSVSKLLFIKHFGGRFCVANIRGGGEYGEAWHSAGTLERKQNVFDDFMYAARYLVQKGYTSKEQLAIMGGSNGGLLVGACVNQHPELFAAAVAQVGVMDMLRFDEFTIGFAWRSDFGSSRASEEQFKTLRAYSPLHNVRKGAPAYPAVLLTTGDHDDRVCPLHSYKYMAELQHTIAPRPEQTRPLLIRIDKDSGHGGGKPTDKILSEAADTYAFIAKHTGATWQP